MLKETFAIRFWITRSWMSHITNHWLYGIVQIHLERFQTVSEEAIYAYLPYL